MTPPLASTMISVVIPTYQEADVIETTLRRAAQALARAGAPFELIVVDDSPDDATARRAESLAGELPVRVLRRRGRRGLATAVVDGWRAARGDLWGVMDGDLQHPPEVIVRLAEALDRPDIDLAIASRYVQGGRMRRWPWRRRALSWLTTHLAASALPWTLARVRDPMSGMFLLRASVLGGVELRPTGYKILLEVLGRGRWRDLVEVPYRFEPRGQGRSKLGWRQSLEYVFHLMRLARATGQLRTWVRYATVGLSGAVLDIGIFLFLVRGAGWPAVLALPAAIELALLSNFAWNQALTFHPSRSALPAGLPGSAERRPPGPSGARSRLAIFGRYQRACLAGAILNALVTLGLIARGGGLLVAASAGVLAGGLWNLLLSVPRIWQAWGAARPPAPVTTGAAPSVERRQMGKVEP